MAVVLPTWGPVVAWVGLSREASDAAEAAGRFPAPGSNGEHWALRVDPASALERAMWTIDDPMNVALWRLEISTVGIGSLIRMGWLTAFGSQHFRLFSGLPLLLTDSGGSVLVRVTPPVMTPP